MAEPQPAHPNEGQIRNYSAFTLSYQPEHRLAGVMGWHTPGPQQEPFETHWDMVVATPWSALPSLLEALLQGWEAIAPRVEQTQELEASGVPPQEAWERVGQWGKREREIGER